MKGHDMVTDDIDKELAEFQEIETVDIEELDTTNRCDRCGAQSYVVVVSPQAFRMDFCKHHYEASAKNLEDQGFTVVKDERGKLTNSSNEVHA